MIAVRCNICLEVFVMRDEVPPTSCPYCSDSASFSLRSPCDSLEKAQLAFASEEREAG